MLDPRSGRDHMTIAQETIKAHDEAEAAVEQARDLVMEFLAERGQASVSDVIQHLMDKGIRSDGAISDALMGLLTAHDVDLDESRRLRPAGASKPARGRGQSGGRRRLGARRDPSLGSP
jgi:hypothetical protein